MITRRHIRRWHVWAGVGVGVLGLIGYVLSFLAPISHTSPGGTIGVAFDRGGFAASWTENESSVSGLALSADMGSHWRWLPRWSERPDPFNPQQQIDQIVIPYWMLLLIGGAAAYSLLPVGYPRGRCQECGYDVKGVPGEGGSVTCPECGSRAAC